MGLKRNEFETDAPPASGYDDELLLANWNPVIALLQWSCSRTLEHVKEKGLSDLNEEEVDALVGRIYTFGA